MNDARERLLKAWRGEIVAGAVYELIAIVSGATYLIGLALPT